MRIKKNQVVLVTLAISIIIIGYVIDKNISDIVARTSSKTNQLAYALLSMFYIVTYFYFEKILIRGAGANCRKSNHSTPIFVATSSIFILINYRYLGVSSLPGVVALIFFSYRIFLIILFDEFDCKSWASNATNKLFVLTLVISGLFLYTYVYINNNGSFSGLVWPQTDARHYHWLSNSIIQLEPSRSYFQLGLALILTPFNYLMDSWQSRTVEALELLNGAMITVIGFIVLPVSHFLTLKAIPGLRRESRLEPAMLISLVVIIASVYLYVYFQPTYISHRDGMFHPLMLLGLVPAVEPFSALIVAFFCYVILNSGKQSFLFIGCVAGFAVLIKESNALIVILFFLGLFLLGGARLKTIKAGFVSLAVYSVQLIYNYNVYDTWLAANRVRQWERVGERWKGYVEKTYDLTFSDAPPLMSVYYMKTNLLNIVEYYWLPILAILSAYIILVKK